MRGDASRLEAWFSPGFVDHDPPGPVPPGIPGVRAVLETLARGLPERSIEIHDLFAAGDRVALRFTLRGRHDGVFLGRPPTGAELELRIIAILRVAEGRIAERWGRVEVAGLAGGA